MVKVEIQDFERKKAFLLQTVGKGCGVGWVGVWDQERNLPKGEEVTFGEDREGMGVSWWSFSQPALFSYLSVQPSTWSTQGAQ